jgi:hypothetical protein
MADPPEEEGAEHRAAARRRVLLSGKVIYGEAQMTLDCAISNLSTSGAQVRLSGPEPLSDPIYLINVRHGLAFRAREAWRRGAVVGLEFTQHFDLRAGSAEAPLIVRRIWLEQTR